MSDAFDIRPLTCPKCGGRLDVFTDEPERTIVCQYCRSVLAVTDENGQLIARYQAAMAGHAQPAIPLGTIGTLRGETLAVIGFMVRKATVDGIDYPWREYLLFNAAGTYRWLTEYDGHWNFVRPISDPPALLVPRVFPMTLTYRNSTYRHFQTASAVVDFVLGEFYWQVRAGERADCADYVSPPFLLSAERTDKEIAWSLGLYVDPAEIQQTFKLPAIKARLGVYANQPNPFQQASSRRARWAGIFCAALIGLWVGLHAIARDEPVFSDRFAFDSSASEKALVTPEFELKGHTSNATLRIDTDLGNNWSDFNFALINSETDVATDFSQEVSYYTGTDQDGYWSEGRRTATTWIPSVPSGRYYLRVEPQCSASTMFYTLTLTRDVPRASYFFWALLALLVPMGFAGVRSYLFEQNRWQESDHPWITESEDDD